MKRKIGFIHHRNHVNEKPELQYVKMPNGKKQWVVVFVREIK
jgi:hypothetical protein